MQKFKNYINPIKNFVTGIFDDLKKVTNRDLYKKSNIVSSNLELGLQHLSLGNISDAIFRFYIVSRFFDKGNQEAVFFLSYAYFIKKDYKRLIKEIDKNKDIKGLGALLQYAKKHASYTSIPNEIIDTYKELTFLYSHRKYYSNEISLPKLLITEILKQIKFLSKDSKVLDLGCCLGLIGKELDYSIKKQYELYGVEANRILYNRVKDLGNSDNNRIYDKILNSHINDFLESAKQKFNVIIAFDSLSFTKDLCSLLNHTKKLLKNEGCIAIVLKKSDKTQISNDLVRFEYDEEYLKDQIFRAELSIISIKTCRIQKNDEYFIIIIS